MSRTKKHQKTQPKKSTLTREYNESGTETIRQYSGYHWSRRDDQSDRMKGLRKSQTRKMRRYLKNITLKEVRNSED